MSRTYKNILDKTNPEATCTLRSPRKTERSFMVPELSGNCSGNGINFRIMFRKRQS